jgi:exopolyphosphatase/pppGpp-phosphohydrolase
MNHSLPKQNKQEIICAAIDIGSNSTELSIARCQADHLEIVPHLPLVSMVTGSSAKSLLKLAKQALKLDAQSKRLTRRDLAACLGILRQLRSEEIAQRYDLEVERARVLPGGALLLLAMLAYLRLDEVRVSTRGVRHGVLRAYARYGQQLLVNGEARARFMHSRVVPFVNGTTRECINPRCRNNCLLQENGFFGYT